MYVLKLLEIISLYFYLRNSIISRGKGRYCLKIYVEINKRLLYKSLGNILETEVVINIEIKGF